MTLTRTERRLLAILAERRGQLVEREELLVRVWGWSAETVGQADTRRVEAHVCRLRRKVRERGVYIIANRKPPGYRLVQDERAAA
jgi:DNA-binding response OmpR family regulator